MHSIKRKAARDGSWHADNGEESWIPVPNPFARWKSQPHSRRRDIEKGNVRRERSINNALSDESRGPPNGSTRGMPPSALQDSNESGAEKDIEAQLPPQKQESGFVDTSVGSATKKGPRRRMFWKPKDNDYRQSSTLSSVEDDDSKKDNANDITVMSQLKVVLLSWVNILLVAVPVGIALGNVNGINGVVIFVVNFIAIIPLAGMLSFATEELAMYIGETLGGLLNASFGNAVELIVGVIALVKKEIVIVKTSLIGSMLSNLLLVLGMCFFFGGLRRTEQHFNLTVAQTAASLLALAIGSLIIPTAFGIFSGPNTGIAPVSRGTSVLLLVTYACYLIFQLRTHVDMYNEKSPKSPKKPSNGIVDKMLRRVKPADDTQRGIDVISSGNASNQTRSTNPNPLEGPSEKNSEDPRSVESTNAEDDDDDDDTPETPQLSRIGALLTLIISTVFVALCAEYMVTGIGAVSASVSQEFIGLILLPIVGNAAEHATAVTVAVKDKMDLAIGVAIGSSLQIALLVLPLMVLLNWFGVGSGSPIPMTLDFNGFLVSVLFIAIILVNYLIQDGKSHWLEGALLQVAYLIIAVSAWFYPTTQNLTG